MPSTRRSDAYLRHTVCNLPAPVLDASCRGFRNTRELLPVLLGGVGVGEGAHCVLMLQAFLDNLTGPGLGTLRDDIFATKDDHRLLRQLRPPWWHFQHPGSGRILPSKTMSVRPGRRCRRSCGPSLSTATSFSASSAPNSPPQSSTPWKQERRTPSVRGKSGRLWFPRIKDDVDNIVTIMMLRMNREVIHSLVQHMIGYDLAKR
ncbi:hypothetical protein B0T18DRAFT_404669 [Schizothecium vesticola]|uniref:Uncharacterized protein n=1 Tax=Schizothecium vesticola TaxID=314040 RepID=A0AA40F6Z6_9PEZI|nr:hypothetical protein B0T18DRAFT_404669 [Schizothecium vesticola]